MMNPNISRSKHVFITASILALFALSAFGQVTSYKFDFGSGPVKAGYTQVLASTTYNAARGYGFDFNVAVTCVDRGGADSLRRDVCFRDGYMYFSVDLPEGNYTVIATLGDSMVPTTTTIKAESRRLFIEKAVTTPGQFVTQTFTVNRRNILIAGTTTSVAITTREQLGLNWDGNKLSFEFNNAHPSVAALEIAQAPAALQVFLAGNSTVCDWATETETAWGQMFPRFFKPGAVIVSLAESGLTTSAFISQRRLTKIISLMKVGDYLFVEFAHNDQSAITLAVYQANLRMFISQARAKGGIPVFVTPTTRRQFNGNTVVANSFVNGTSDFLAGFKQVATDSNVTLIDLNAMSAAFIQSLGPTGSAVAYWNNNGTIDGTHWSPYGAYELAKCVVEGIRTKLPGLVPYLTADVLPFDPTHPDDTTWALPASADTSVWHYHVAGVSGGSKSVESDGNLSWNSRKAQVLFVAPLAGEAEFTVYAVDGTEMLRKQAQVSAGAGSFKWEEVGKLSEGAYFLSMKLNGRHFGKIQIVKN